MINCRCIDCRYCAYVKPAPPFFFKDKARVPFCCEYGQGIENPYNHIDCTDFKLRELIEP